MTSGLLLIDAYRCDQPGYGDAVVGRLGLRDVTPVVDSGAYPARAVVGERVPISALVFREGHDLLGAELVLTDPSGATTVHPLAPGAPGTDRWTVHVPLVALGEWTYLIRAYSDDWATWLHNAEIKVPAGIDVELMFAMAAELLQRGGRLKIFTDATAALLDTTLSPAARLKVATDPRLSKAIAARPIRSLVTESETVRLRVERDRKSTRLNSSHLDTSRMPSSA